MENERPAGLMLGDLKDPGAYHTPLEISGRDVALLRDFLRTMILSRMVEEHLAVQRREGTIGGPVHLGVGQEAVAVGVSQFLRSSDRVFGAHRSHYDALALGTDFQALFAEILGKETGLSKGMGGSMHLWDEPRGFYGSVPIVGGTVQLAVAAALLVGITPQLCTVEPPINAAIEFCDAKNWNCTPCRQPKTFSKKSRIKIKHKLLPAPGMPNKRQRLGSVSFLLPGMPFGACHFCSSRCSVKHLSITYSINLVCSPVGGVLLFRTFLHQVATFVFVN